MFSQPTHLIGTIIVLSAISGVSAEEPDAEHRRSKSLEMQLIAAAKDQDASRVADVLRQGASADASQGDGATALHWAVYHDDVETARTLIQAGANVNIKNELGVMPLSLASTNGNASMVRLLVDAGADPNEILLTGETPLMTASRTGIVEAVQVLIDHGANVNAFEPVRRQTALMWALGKSRADVATVLINAGADINAATTLGSTPLMFAVRRGDLETAKMLLDGGAYVNATMKSKLSVLHIATQRGHVDVAHELLSRGADASNDGPGWTALHWAAGTWETDLTGPFGIAAPPDHEWFLMSGLKSGKLELVKALIEAGADPNARMTKSPTRFGQSTARLPIGATPYLLAAYAGEAEIMQLLFDAGADPLLKADNGQNAVVIAAGPTRRRSEMKVSPENLLAAMKTAVRHGVNVNELDKAGNSALHGAAWLRSVEMVEFLHEHGADMNVENKSGKSALYYADHDGIVPGSGDRVAVRLPVGKRIHELSIAMVAQDPDE